MGVTLIVVTQFHFLEKYDTRQVQCDEKLCRDGKIENHVRSMWCQFTLDAL